MFYKNIPFGRIISIIFILFTIVAFQAFFSELTKIARVKLDFPLLILVYLSLTKGAKEGAFFGFLIGFVLDILNPSFLGLNALIKSTIGFAIGSFKDTLFLESLYFKIAIVFSAVLANDFFFFLLSSSLNFKITGENIWSISTLSALYTGGVGILVFLVPKRLSVTLT